MKLVSTTIALTALLTTGGHAGTMEVEPITLLGGSAPPLLHGQVEDHAFEGVDDEPSAVIITLDAPLLEGIGTEPPQLEGVAEDNKLVGIGEAASLEGIGKAPLLEGVKKPTPIVVRILDPAPTPVLTPTPVTKEIITLRDLGFAYDSATLDPAEREFIGKLARKIKQNNATKIRLVGHTDNRGSWDYNLELSVRRADAVKRALTDWYGFDPSAIAVTGRSYDMAEPATTEAEHARNRRVVVHLE